MIILQPITSAQGFVIAQRQIDDNDQRANKLKLVDEETNASRIINITGTTNGDYYDTITVTINPALKEGHTYKATMYYNTTANTRYRGRVFCTAQITTSGGFNDIRDYSVNDGKFTETTSTNEFIFND